MHMIIICLLPITFISLVNGASYSKRDKFIVGDNEAFELNGMWYVHRLEGDNDLNKKIVCYSANVSQNNLHTFNYMTFTTDNGDTIPINLIMTYNEKKTISLTLYNIRDDGSRGSRICNFLSTKIGDVFIHKASSKCKIGSVANYNTVCVKKGAGLSDEDKATLNSKCPESSFVDIKNACYMR